MSCNHGNGVLTEEHLTIFDLLTGSSGADAGRIRYECRDCGLLFGPTAIQSAPGWLQEKYLAAQCDMEAEMDSAWEMHALPKEGTMEICLDADDMKCLERGGSIEYDVDACKVSLSLAS